MAYPRPPPPPPPSSYHPLQQTSHDTERKHAVWDTLPRPQYPTMASPSAAPMLLSSHAFDPESESSDVSDTGEEYRPRSQPVMPTGLPPPMAKIAFESQDAIQTRLRELSRVEDSNIRKLEVLKAKRLRKDEKIRRKREAQDLKIKAIMDARFRRDERILRRRRIEDEAFERVDQELEEEETNLRRRMKRLKRGLPLDDIMNHDRGYSPASMSPPGPAYSSIPPAKRHQPGPPGQHDSPTATASRLAPYNTPTAQHSPTASQIPSYSFLHSSHPPPPPPPPTMTVATNPPGIYSHSPHVVHMHSPVGVSHSHHAPPPPPPPPSHLPSHSTYPLTEPVQPGPNGAQSSPQSSFTSGPPHQPANLTSMPNTAPPPRQVSSTYDTRPPPSTSSGFASINQPPTTGFAAINARATSTPPVPASSTPGRDPPGMASRAAEYDRIYGLNRQSSDSTPTSVASTPMTGGKRAPSTTHPYQMSEAFANRHHHCERVDKLNRGIWTYYGPGGTADKPTEPAKEMYLRCNHADCRRIDWRTVHGLQCHIVKNHEQPKGTIGSLEKALDRYGVPVSEIEAYEQEHGEGTGGTMADVKSLKLKQKARESSDKAEARKWSDGSAQVSTYRDNIAMTLGGSTFPPGSKAAAPPSLANGQGTNSESPSNAANQMPAANTDRPAGGFAAVNGAWGNSNMSQPVPQDVEMRDAPTLSAESVGNPKEEHGPDRNARHASPLGPGHQSGSKISNLSVATSKQAASSIVPVSQTAEAVQIPELPPQETPTVAAAAAAAAASTATEQGTMKTDDKQSLPELSSEKTELSKPEGTVASEEPIKITQAESPAPAETSATPTKVTEAESDLSDNRPRTANGAKAIETAIETPKAKVEIEDEKKSAATSPEGSGGRIPMSARRGSSRRSSLAASKAAEREKELQRAKEREEEAAIAAATAAARSGGTDTATDAVTAEAEKGVAIETDKKPVNGEDEEQGDSITVATNPGPITRDRKERDREDTGGRSSKRLASGRHVNKKR